MKRHLWAVFVAILSSAQTLPTGNTVTSIEGRVVFSETQTPARKARISLRPDKQENGFELVATSDETGLFRFVDIEPGSYNLIAEKPGYLPGLYGQIKYDDAESVLKVGAGENLKGVILRLFPASAISGQVVDADGDPAPGCNVLLWRQDARPKNSHARVADQTVTDRNGQYRFGGLMPGTYFVSAEIGAEDPPNSLDKILVDASGKRTNLHDYRTFFPSTISIEAAQQIHLSPGQEYDGADIHAQRGPLFSVAGKLAGALGPLSQYAINISVDQLEGWTGKRGRLGADGSFNFSDIPPGKHRLTLTREGKNGLQTVGSTEVTIDRENIAGIVIAPYDPAGVRVQVFLEGRETPLTVGSVFLQPVTESRAVTGFSVYEFTPDNGIYVLKDVAPGRYIAGFTNAPHSFLKSIRVGESETSSNTIEISNGSRIDLVLTYSPKVASVSGTIEVSGEKPPKTIHIILVEEGENARPGVYGVVADQFLHFSIEDRKPGKYRVFATEDADLELWDQPSFIRLLQSEGAVLELHESEHANVSVKLITSDVISRVRQQLGL